MGESEACRATLRIAETTPGWDGSPHVCDLPSDHDGPHDCRQCSLLWTPGSHPFSFTQTGDGVGASPAATAEPRTPSAQADQDDRTPTPSSPRTFELVRHHDVSGQTGTGVVAEGVQFSDLTAALRWRGGHPATAVWPNVEEILAVHGHEGLTVLHWLDERTCRVCGCTDESACVGGCYWVADSLCSQCGDGPGVPS